MTPTATRRTPLESLGRSAPSASELLLLRAALCEPAAAGRAWSEWRANHEPGEAGRGRAVLPAIVANLGVDALRDDAAAMARIRRRVWVRSQLALLRTEAVIVALADLQYPPIACKGVALCATVHEPGTRTMGDIDLLVDPSELDRARVLLEGEGWCARTDPPLQPFDHAVTLVNAEGHELDVHRWLLHTRFTRSSEAGLRDRAATITIGATPCLVPSDVDSLVIAVVTGLIPGDTNAVRWPLDVAALLNDLRADDPGLDATWSSIVEVALELGVGPILSAGLDLCRTELDLDVPMQVIDRLRSAPLDRVFQTEWWLRRRGLRNVSRLRRYIDTSRALDRRPSFREYTSARRAAVRQHRSFGSALKSRIHRLEEAATSHRQAGRS